VLGFAFAGQLYLSRSKIGDPVTWIFALSRALADWYTFMLLSLPVLWLAQRFQFERGRWQQAFSIHLIGSAIFSIAWMALRAVVEQWQTRGEMHPIPFAAAFGRALVATFFFNLLVYWGIVIVRHAFAYYWKFHEREVHTAELETRLTQARLQALQMQLNPHFLFNTLNAIASLMHKDVEAADRMITQLSDLLRYTLESTEAHEVPLRQEVDFLDRYLEIQQARFGDRLTVRREIAAETLDALVPNLLLQPLVENALNHGIAPHARPGQIVLRTARQNDRLQLEVQDTGAGLPTNRVSEGVGLANTRARLLQLYGSAQRLELLNVSEGGLLVRVTMPFRAEVTGQTGTESRSEPVSQPLTEARIGHETTQS
jgi:signal transduction histidine kinase